MQRFYRFLQHSRATFRYISRALRRKQDTIANPKSSVLTGCELARDDKAGCAETSVDLPAPG